MEIEEQQELQEGYIAVDEAATALGISRTNLYYYANQLNIETKKFRLGGRKAYIRRSDVERIKVSRGLAGSTSRIASDDVLVFLAGLGLAVTPHSDPALGWGYSWQGGDWEGTYKTPIAAIQAAFDRAVQDHETVRQMPFLTNKPELHWWDGAEWYTTRRSNGEVEVFTGNTAKNDGYERLEEVETRREAWLQPIEPTGDEDVNEERERARLAAQLLHSAFQIYLMALEPIDWQQQGLKAPVIVNGVKLGTLLAVYNRNRKTDNFLEWVKSKLAIGTRSVGSDPQPD